MDRSVFESCEEDADELFNHLEELLRGKDAMEKKGRRLAQARAAREVLERQRSVLGLSLIHIYHLRLGVPIWLYPGHAR